MPKFKSSVLFVAPLLLFALTVPIALGGINSTAYRPSQYTAGIGVVNLGVTQPGGGGAISTAFMIGGALVPSVSPGDTLVIQFTSVYLAGSRGGVLPNDPVDLEPQTASFGFSTADSTSMFKTLINQTVTPTSQRATYTYTFQVTPDFPTGPVVIWVLAGSLHDSHLNWGPPQDVSTDLSRLVIGTPESWLSKYGVPLLIAALLILALILFLARGRKKQKKA